MTIDEMNQEVLKQKYLLLAKGVMPLDAFEKMSAALNAWKREVKAAALMATEPILLDALTNQLIELNKVIFELDLTQNLPDTLHSYLISQECKRLKLDHIYALSRNTHVMFLDKRLPEVRFAILPDPPEMRIGAYLPDDPINSSSPKYVVVKREVEVNIGYYDMYYDSSIDVLVITPEEAV